MLNITVYQNVPFQSNYNNVCLFNNQSALNTYLAQYMDDTINNIAQFFDGNNEITLPKFYENCNYMRIEDTNAITQNKYFFIDHCEFVSGGGIKYHLILDVWATYQYDIEMFDSLMTMGHLDVLSSGKSLFRFKSFTNANNIIASNLLIEPQSATSTDLMSIIALVNYKAPSGNAPTQCGTISKRVAMQDGSLQGFLWELAKGKIYVGTNPTHEYDFNVIKLYLVPNFYYDVLFNNYTNAVKTADFYNDGVGEFLVDFVDGYYDEQTQGGATVKSFIPFIFEGTINSKNVYSNITEQTNVRIASKVFVGTLGNYKEIEIPLEDNPLMTLKFNITGLSQIEISLEIADNKINLTTSFEIPYFNDEYLQYMNRNQNQIDVANKTNVINTMLSLATIGATATLSPLKTPQMAGLAIGAVSSGTGFLTNMMTQSAKLDDLKNNIARIDGTNNNCILVLRFGVGSFISSYNDNAINEKYRFYGADTQTYINDFKPVDASLYNFYFLQIPNINISGNFNDNIKKVLISIFNNGVRIWCDSSEYLNNVNYKK